MTTLYPETFVCVYPLPDNNPCSCRPFTSHHPLLQVKELEAHRVLCVACGFRDAQTLAAVESGQLWAWGDNSFGKMGLKEPGLRHSLVPVMVRDFGKEGIAQVECGSQFSVLLTKTGKVFSW